MAWGHTHRDGTYKRHEDGVACDLDQPAKLRPSPGTLADWGAMMAQTAPPEAFTDNPVVNADTGGGADPRRPLITEPLTVEVTVGGPAFPDTSSTVKQAVDALELAGPDPAYSAGRVDFADMLKTDAQWSLKHRFDELLGRPYLATQLAAMLPADVALRLVERAEAVIVLRTQANLDRLANEIHRTTEATIDRLAKTANDKREELKRERFGRTTRLS